MLRQFFRGNLYEFLVIDPSAPIDRRCQILDARDTGNPKSKKETRMKTKPAYRKRRAST
jgi:hypothetical protein